MLFITMEEMRRHYPDATLYFDTQEKKIDTSQYYFEQIDREALRNALRFMAKEDSLCTFLFKALKHAVRFALEKNYYAVIGEIKYLKILKRTGMLIDISGYALSSKFSQWQNDLYLDIIRCATKLDISTYIMPQSFGPFDYENDAEGMKKRIVDSLKDVKHIFARENSGYDELSGLGVKNIEKSYDLVLQDSTEDLSFTADKKDIDDGKFKDHVLIVPNEKLLTRFSKEDLYSLYDSIIEALIAKGNEISLIFHSNDDHVICDEIKKRWKDEERVHLCNRELMFYEYSRVAGRSKYIIASRYHSIILAYKESVPCIGIGWADKYEELFHDVGQEKYVIQIFEDGITKKVLDAIDKMEIAYQSEKQIIGEKIVQIRQNSCFKTVFRIEDGR